MSYLASRQRKPCSVGDVVRVLDRFDGVEYVGEVNEVRWDKWLKGGEWRIFLAIDGELHLHYHGSEILREDGHQDLLDLLETA